MKFTSALAIALLSITTSASFPKAGISLPNPRTACETKKGPNHAGVCKVYEVLDATKETGEQVNCMKEHPCMVNQNGCVIWVKNGKKVAKFRNQIYDEIIQQRERSPSIEIGLSLGKSYHSAAVCSGSNQLPRSLFCKQDLGSDFFNETVDRWCSTVAFQLIESFELDIKRPWLGLRAITPKCSSPHLGRYFDPAATRHLIPELNAAIWFPRMRKCYLKVNLFNLRSLLKNGKDGRENLRSCLAEVAGFLKRATALTDTRIDVVLWAQKMPNAKERERPKFINTDDVNYAWEISEKDNFASHLDACFGPLQEVPGIQTIRVYGVNLIDAWWNVDEPDNFQSRVPALLSTSSSSQRHFIPTM
ncbi:hypothetical protein EG327_008682 [Venturia inaequalis]|uniref:Uncharacterized protein n=1 Tax=Venturia inaequalis TaxID=5025 RepID=A0A8H3ZAQ6_VENIN|nr:hypothetical protein EG327_008682 [Venturia inaequalis]